MPTEFYFEIQYFNFDWKITITLVGSHRNTQQWQVRLKSATFSNSGMLPPNVDHHACAGILFAAAVTMSLQKCLMLLGSVPAVVLVLNFTEFLKYRYLNIHEFLRILNFRILNSQSIATFTSYTSPTIGPVRRVGNQSVRCTVHCRSIWLVHARLCTWRSN